MLTTALLFVLAAAPLAKPTPASAIAADGRVVTPEGIRFRLPPGLAYRVEATEDTRAYVAQSSDESRLVAVTAARSDTDLPCEASQEGASVRPYRTPRGLRACLVDAEAPEGAGAMTLGFVKSGDVLVTVVAIATSGSSSGLAAGVADTVEIDARAGQASTLRVANMPRAEPRLVGCFEQSWGMSMGAGHSFGRVWWKRCFREDLTFSETSSVAVMTEHKDPVYGDHEGTSSASGEQGERRGSWHYADGVLAMVYADGSESEWEISFSPTGDGLLASGKLWERL